MQLITTSWDDGHLLDFKLASLLQKYNLPATFYVPKSNPERTVMSAAQIKILAKDFEIGGHGLNHASLNSTDRVFLKNEINGSYNWLSNLLGASPQCFCFPGGKFNHIASDIVLKSGYQLARTTELFSTELTHPTFETATTLQAYPHSNQNYTRHLLKRRKWKVFFNWMRTGSEKNLVKLTQQFLDNISMHGGCFHLWGHSWEIEKYNQWNRVEELFKLMQQRSGFSYIANKGLIKY